jgi:hypothetical protein
VLFWLCGLRDSRNSAGSTSAFGTKRDITAAPIDVRFRG